MVCTTTIIEKTTNTMPKPFPDQLKAQTQIQQGVSINSTIVAFSVFPNLL
jgi:hypothetical protein